MELYKGLHTGGFKQSDYGRNVGKYCRETNCSVDLEDLWLCSECLFGSNNTKIFEQWLSDCSQPEISPRNTKINQMGNRVKETKDQYNMSIEERLFINDKTKDNGVSDMSSIKYGRAEFMNDFGDFAAGDIAEFVNDFGDFAAGDIVAVTSVTSIAYEVRTPIDLDKEAKKTGFVPKQVLKILGNNKIQIDSKNSPLFSKKLKESQPIQYENRTATPIEKPKIPIPSPEFSNKESQILDMLVDTSIKTGKPSFENINLKNAIDSGVKSSGFVPPPESKKEKVERKAIEKINHIRDKLKPHSKPALEPFQFWLSDLTGGRLPESKLDHKVNAYPKETWSEEQQKDIPEVDVNYYWNPDVLEAIILAYTLNQKILITGLPGTGKTTATNQFASHIQQPWMRFNGKDGIEQSSFLGYPWAVKEGMEWKDGILPLGLKAGYLICLDEVFKIPAGIQMSMQGLYEKNGKLMLDDKPGEYHEKLVTPDSKARLMLTDNVKGTGDDFEKFSSTQIQDSSTLDRFDVTIELPYLDTDSEEKMLSNMFPTVKSRTISKLVKFASLVRSGYKLGEIALTLSPRGLISTLEMNTKTKVPVKIALSYAFINKIAEDTELQALKQMLSTVGLSN